MRNGAWRTGQRVAGNVRAVLERLRKTMQKNSVSATGRHARDANHRKSSAVPLHRNTRTSSAAILMPCCHNLKSSKLLLRKATADFLRCFSHATCPAHRSTFQSDTSTALHNDERKMSDRSAASRHFVSPSSTNSKLTSSLLTFLITELTVVVIFHTSKGFASADTVERVLESNKTVSVEGEGWTQLRRPFTRHVSFASV
jgi:hypothetical protein